MPSGFVTNMSLNCTNKQHGNELILLYYFFDNSEEIFHTKILYDYS